jgi:hypothetical protein
MSLPSVTVKKGATTITNVQTCTMTKGKVKVSDNLRPGTATITGRRPDLLPSLEIGDNINVLLYGPDGIQYQEYEYRVADLRVDYGFLSSMDTWTLELEDAFAYLGRALVTRTWTAGTPASTVAYNICADVGIYLGVNATSLSTVSAQIVTDGSALDVFQTLVNTEAALVQAGATGIQWYSRGWQSSLYYRSFSDDGTGTLYDALTFGSLADNYADKVVVYPRGGTEVVTGTGIFSYNLDSYSFDTGQATQLGLYMKGVFDVQNSTPLTMSVLLNQDTYPWNMLNATQVGNAVSITFRGNTYNALIEGFTVTSDTTATRITYNLSSTAFYAFLTLNDAVLGRLDYNKLGF